MLTISRVGDDWILSSSVVLSGIHPDSDLHPATTSHLQALTRCTYVPSSSRLGFWPSLCFLSISFLSPYSMSRVLSQNALCPCPHPLSLLASHHTCPTKQRSAFSTPATRLSLIPLGPLPHAHTKNLHYLEFGELPGVLSWLVSLISPSPPQPFKLLLFFYLNPSSPHTSPVC